jgi:hypothetical protein
VDESPGYIELCLRSQRRNLAAGFQHVHLDLESAKDWVPEHELLWQMSAPANEGNSVSHAGRRIAIFTGMLRVALLHRHGGLWVDADTLVFPQVQLLAPLIEDFDLVCGEAAGGNLGNAVLGGRSGSPFFQQYWAAILARIEQKRGSEDDPGAKWGEFGFRMASDVFHTLGPDKNWIAPWGVLNTIDHQLTRPTFEPGATIAGSLSPNALGLSIFNNGTAADLRARTAEELLAEETLFAASYRVAMGEGEAPHLCIRNADQLRALNRAHVTYRLSAEAERLVRRNDRLRDQNDALRARVERSVERRDALQEQLRHSRSRTEELDGEIRRLRAQEDDTERSFSGLRALVHQARRRLAGRP